MTQEKAKEQAEDEVVDDNAQEAKEQIVDDNAQEAKERAEDEVPHNNAQEVKEIFTQGCQDDEYYTDSETGERIRNPFIAGSTWCRQLGYRSEYFAEWKEHFEEMTKLCQEAMDLREERDNLLYGFVDDIRSEQDALFDVLTYREDVGLSKLSQRARERKERNLSLVEQRQKRTVGYLRHNLDCQIRNIKDLRALQGHEDEFVAYLDQQQYSTNTLLEEMILKRLVASCIPPMVTTMSDPSVDSNDDPCCMVCFELGPQKDMEGRLKKKIAACPSCGIFYHQECLTKWRDENPEFDCILCRPKPRQG